MVEDEQMTEAKQQFAIEAFGLMALASVLYSSSKQQGQAFFSSCGIDPF